MIYNGEIGKYEGVRFIEQTNVPHGRYTSGNFVSSASFTAWSTGLSDWAFFFGEDTVARFWPVTVQAVNDNIVNSGDLLAA